MGSNRDPLTVAVGIYKWYQVTNKDKQHYHWWGSFVAFKPQGDGERRVSAMIRLPSCTLWHMILHRKINTGTHTHILRKEKLSTASMFKRTKSLSSIFLYIL